MKRHYLATALSCLLLLALAAIPFAVKVMYLERAWVSSPIDRIHLGLYGTLSLIFVFIAVVAKLYWRFLTVKPLAQSRSLKLMVLPCILYVIGIVWSMNAVQLISSVLILPLLARQRIRRVRRDAQRRIRP